MKGGVYLDEWLGRRGDPLEPEAMRYVTAPAKSCRGCLFSGGPAAICDRAIAAAVRVELESCEKGFIYVRNTDPRQVDLVDALK